MERRAFLAMGALAPLAVEKLGTWKALGQISEEDGETPIERGKWFTAEREGDGLAYEFAPGTLGKVRGLTCDLLLDGRHLVVFQVALEESATGRVFKYSFGLLNQCGARMRLDLGLVDQNRWLSEREGALLKPSCNGDRVELGKVDRLRLTVLRKGPQRARWAMTELQAVAALPPRLTEPVLPKGPLVDEMGQSRLADWAGKTKTVEELGARMRGQLEGAPRQAWPAGWSRWGGFAAKRLTEGSGYFGVKKDGGRWWLVDPEGYAFWSTGLDCVRVDGDARVDGIESALQWKPEYVEAWRGGAAGRGGQRSVNYLAANLMRAVGVEDWKGKWAQMALAEMKKLRFNTVGNWSEWEAASKAKFPYVRPLNFRPGRCGTIYRDFPDVFHTGFEADVEEFARPLAASAQDAALIGYFLMNEPTWGFSSELPATGMLYTTESCAARAEFARALRQRYEGEAALQKAWGAGVTFERVAAGKWQGLMPKGAEGDLRAFSVRLVERYFQALSQAAKRVDRNHLNLGMRWAGVPPEWAVEGMKSFDVFSLNCYMDTLPRERTERIHEMLAMPVLVGEWHFGALDAGLPASGIGHLKNQRERGKAYRRYLEDAAAGPYCVGAHWFTLYDQSALGRFDGENYNIGFLDVCHRPYEELGEAARTSHEALFEVASGRVKPYAEAPEYLPKLFL